MPTLDGSWKPASTPTPWRARRRFMKKTAGCSRSSNDSRLRATGGEPARAADLPARQCYRREHPGGTSPDPDGAGPFPCRLRLSARMNAINGKKAGFAAARCDSKHESWSRGGPQHYFRDPTEHRWNWPRSGTVVGYGELPSALPGIARCAPPFGPRQLGVRGLIMNELLASPRSGTARSSSAASRHGADMFSRWRHQPSSGVDD